MRLHVAVHDALRVAIVEGVEERENVVPHVEVGELGVELAEAHVLDVLENEGRGLALRVHDLVDEANDIWPSADDVEHSDLALDLLLLDGLEDLDDDEVCGHCVVALEDLTILPTPDLGDDLVAVGGVPLDLCVLIVPVLGRLGAVDVFVMEVTH